MIDLSDALLVGTTTALTLLDVIEDEKLKGRRVLLAGIHQPEVKRSFQQLGIFDLVQDADRIENTGRSLKSPVQNVYDIASEP